MVYIGGTDSSIDSLVKRYCAPLFGTGPYLRGGHNDTSLNATVTFVQFKSRIYAVTCHHVLGAFRKQMIKTGRLIVPSIHAGRSVHQFGSYGNEGVYQWAFSSCRDFPDDSAVNDSDALSALESTNSTKPDVAIAELTQIWPSFAATRDVEAVNLDVWTAPDWSRVQDMWMAYGFPDRHKYQSDGRLTAPMPRVVAQLQSGFPAPVTPCFTLCSTLTACHGWGFSGMSGGPILAPSKSEDRFAFIGITFEGTPSVKDPPVSPGAFTTGADIILSGYQLTPTFFQEWLDGSRYGVRVTEKFI